MIGGIGYTELILIFLIILLLFGGKKLPELAGALGQAINEFTRTSRGLKEIGEKEVGKPKEEKSDIRPLAEEAGIDVEGKSDEELRKELLERAK